VRAPTRSPPDIELDAHLRVASFDVDAGPCSGTSWPKRETPRQSRRAMPLAMRRRKGDETMIVSMPGKKLPKNRLCRHRTDGEAGVDVHRTTGTGADILAVVGPREYRLSVFEVLPGVLNVLRISSPYKLAGRRLFRTGGHGGGVPEQRQDRRRACRGEARAVRDRKPRSRSSRLPPA